MATFFFFILCSKCKLSSSSYCALNCNFLLLHIVLQMAAFVFFILCSKWQISSSLYCALNDRFLPLSIVLQMAAFFFDISYFSIKMSGFLQLWLKTFLIVWPKRLSPNRFVGLWSSWGLRFVGLWGFGGLRFVGLWGFEVCRFVGFLQLYFFFHDTPSAVGFLPCITIG